VARRVSRVRRRRGAAADGGNAWVCTAPLRFSLPPGHLYPHYKNQLWPFPLPQGWQTANTMVIAEGPWLQSTSGGYQDRWLQVAGAGSGIWWPFRLMRTTRELNGGKRPKRVEEQTSAGLAAQPTSLNTQARTLRGPVFGYFPWLRIAGTSVGGLLGSLAISEAVAGIPIDLAHVGLSGVGAACAYRLAGLRLLSSPAECGQHASPRLFHQTAHSPAPPPRMIRVATTRTPTRRFALAPPGRRTAIAVSGSRHLRRPVRL
jgi:hypothetical protein